MTTEPIPPSREPSRNRLVTLTWLFLGILAYWYASAALGGAMQSRSILPLFVALAMESPLLAMTLVVAIAPMFPILGYVALRYWVLPPRAQSWRNGLGVPLIVLPCMVVASVLSGYIAAFVALSAAFVPTALVHMLALLLAGALAGLSLCVIERLATRLLFGRGEAARLGLALCGAHAVGLVAVLVAGSSLVTLGIYIFHVAISQTWAGWFVFPVLVCGEIVHLLLTWRAWRRGSPAILLSGRNVLSRVAAAFVGLSLIGAAARIPSSADPLQTLVWPVSYFIGFSKL